MVLPFIIFFLLIILYLISVYPADIASYLVGSFNTKLQNSKQLSSSVWFFLDKIRKQRLVVLLALFFVLFFVIYANFYFLKNIDWQFIFSKTNHYFIIIFVSFLAVISYVISEIIKYGGINIPEAKPQKSIELKRAIENLAIRMGVKIPDFKILAFNSPTSFSIYPNFHKPIIYVTTPLLSMADNNELEAVIAHEMAHIHSGRVLYFKRVNNILIVIRAFSYLLLLLFLLSVSSSFLYVWLVYLIYVTIQSSIRVEKVGEVSTVLKGMITLFNPPYAIIKFFTYLIYYYVVRNEKFYADLKAVELTRFPAGLYSILYKIKHYKRSFKKLPEKFSYLYFTGENTSFGDIPMAQPTIKERKARLIKLDKTLSSQKHLETLQLKCANCRNSIEQLLSTSLYGNVFESYVCKSCSYFWFDSYSLWNLNLNNDQANKYKDINVKEPLICPRCYLNLKLMKDSALPVNLKIWHCSGCQGDLISGNSLAIYKEYRKKYLA